VPSNILLIEDNPANMELMSYILRAFGYSIKTAQDGLEGLMEARREPPNLIICDIQLPTMDGFEVARLLKSDPHLRGVPLLAVTALAMMGDRNKVMSAGFDGYITKPINPETFVTQIEEYLHSPRRAAEPIPRAAEPPPTPQPPGDSTVLVVDNLAVNIDLARSILEPNGYRVIAATGVHEGLVAAREESCDLILSDVCMGGESGYDFIQAIKADCRLAAIPFVFITSTAVNESDRARGLALGATRFLFRPIEPSELLTEIKNCLLAKERIGHGGHPHS
jgi:two-component system cell cycle response regulator